MELQTPVAEAQVTVDPSALPSSHVDALPEFVSSNTISVAVSATDHGAGIGLIGLYSRCQADGSPSWSAWGGAGGGGWPTSGLSADLVCGDARYEFYSVAVDWAGNEEVRDPSPDAFTNLDSVTPTSSVGTVPAIVSSPELSIPFTASDGDGSVAIVELWQRFKPAGGSAGSWTEVASVTSSPVDVQLAMGDGTYDFYTIAIDGAGNEEAVPTTWWLFGPEVTPDASVRLDTTAPTSGVGSLPAAVSGTTLSVPFTASDGPGSGLASVELWGRFEAAGTTDWTSWTQVQSGLSSPFGINLDQGQGRYEFYTIAVDAIGNREAAPSVADAFTVLDMGTPVTAVNPLATATNATSVSVSYTVGAGSPAASVEIWKRFEAAGSTTWSAWTKATTVTSSPVSISVPSEGTYEFYSIGISAGGVREPAPASADASIFRDIRAPTSVASGPAYVNDPVIAVTYTADGTGSGVSSLELWWRFQPPGGSAGSWTYLATNLPGYDFDVDLNQGNGTYGFYTVAIDEAGNRESPFMADFSTVLDRTAPTSSASALAAITKTPTISVNYSASDNSNGSGLAPTELWERYQAAGSADWSDWSIVTTKTSSPFSAALVQGDGRYEFYTVAVDRSGNREAAPASADAWTVLDTGTPTSAAGSLPGITTATSITVPYTVSVPDPSGSSVSVQLWQRSQNPVTGVWTAWSKVSTIANGATLTANLGSDGRFEVYTIATDAAGNTETKAQSAETFTVRDRTAPVTTVTALPTDTTSTSQTIAFAASDNGGTGLVSLALYGRFAAAGGTPTWTSWGLIANLAPTDTSVAVTLGSGDGRYEYSFVGTDVAGNVEAGASQDTYTTLDRTAPASNVWGVADARSNTSWHCPALTDI
jgi:hypothetical protein